MKASSDKDRETEDQDWKIVLNLCPLEEETTLILKNMILFYLFLSYQGLNYFETYSNPKDKDNYQGRKLL